MQPLQETFWGLDSMEFSSAVRKHARLALYALLGALVLLQTFWDVHRVSSTAHDDDVEISAARRLPRVVGFSDAIY
jgi:hypothetical protein